MKQLGAHNLKQFFLTFVVFLTAQSIWSQQQPTITPIFTPALEDRDSTVQYKIVVQLAGRAQTGSLKIYRKNPANPTEWIRTHRCDSSNSYHTIGGDDPHIKTPSGRFQPIETSDNLLYRGRFLNSVRPATYFYVVHATNSAGQILGRAPVAIHNGHRAGQNSHGCVRTEDSCAQEVRRIADEVAQRGTGTSKVFTAYERSNYGIATENARTFAGVVIELLPFAE